MKTFEKIISVTPEDLDDLNHVNNVRYVQWIQDIAKEHWFHESTKEMNSEYVWVVLNHNIDYKNSAVLNDKILIRTYVEKSEGVTSTRVVEMYHNQTNRLIVKSKTKWCLLDAKTFKPSRITEEIINLFQ